MNFGRNQARNAYFALAGLVVLIGTYNSVVINAESGLSGSDVRFIKRLDELYGVTVPGREVAAAASWQKIPSIETQVPVSRVVPVVQAVTTVAAAPAPAPAEPETPPAAVQEELSLSLVEVINPTKWHNGLPSTQFAGTLSANNGIIEELSVSLPNDQSLSVSFTEMTGNVFEYDFDGEVYSGMMYQVDQTAYMVTLTNGPLEGTRLRFSSQAPAEQQQEVQETLAQNNNVDVGTFGDPASELAPDALAENDGASLAPQASPEELQAQGFNLEPAQSM
jgi:hypothetical protein